MDLKRLSDKFPEREIEWRIGRAGQNKNGPYAHILAYLTNRAIMERLDSVCGPGGWKNEYKPGPSGGVLCGISIKIENEWVTKWDGAENTQIESVKGGLSDSMKRAAVQWGIGRYLYYLPQFWAVILQTREQGCHFQPKDKNGKYEGFFWKAPGLPLEFIGGE